MSQPYPLPREIRSTGQMAFNGSDQVYGPFDFKVFDIEDVAVYLKHDGEDAYTKTAAVTVTKTSDLDYDTFSVDFGAVHPATSTYVVQGERTPERSIAVTKGGGIKTAALEKDLTKLAVEDQELRRDVARSLRYDVGFDGGIVPKLAAGHFFKTDADGNLVDGGDAGDIENAQENAETATEKAAEAALAAAAALGAANAGYLFDTKADAEAAAVSAAVEVIQLAGRDEIGDYGGGFLREITEDGSPVYPSQLRSNVNTRRWEVADVVLDCGRYFGVRSGATPTVVRTGINDAISESARLGRAARLPPEEVEVNARLLPITGSSLIGFGRHSAVKLADGSDANLIEALTETDICLKNFTLKPNRSNQSQGNGLVFDEVSDFEVSGLRVLDALENGMLFRDCEDGRVIGNKVLRSGNASGTHGISVAYDTVVGSSRRLIIAHNHIQDPYGSGINVSGAFRTIVVANSVEQSGAYAFDDGYAAVRFTNGAAGCVAIGNVSEGMGRGLFIASTAGRGNSLIGNILRACGQEAVLVQASGSLVKGNKINGVGGTVSGVAGIKVNETPTMVQIIANEILDLGSGMAYGIEFNTTTARHAIHGNVIEGYTTAPIQSDTVYIKASGNIWPTYESATIAAASTIALPFDTGLHVLTGSGTITDITGGHFGCVAMLRVPAGITITDGGNLRLAGDMTGATGRTITLTRTGPTTWEEISRSLN